MQQSHQLARLFEPESVAVIGASPRPDSTAHFVFANLLAGGYAGRVWAVNPKHDEVLQHRCVASLEAIEGRIDLAIIATAPRSVPGIVEQCARAGVRQAVLLSDLATAGSGAELLRQRVLDVARSGGVRLLGGKSLGLMRPSIGLNATFADVQVQPGDLALVTQSGAMCAAVLDWAAMNRIGVSAAVNLGAAIDIDFGEVLDYLVHDDRTRFVLLHVERVRQARRFLSALRSAARVKPVLLLKSGSDGEAQDATLDPRNYGDAVFDAAVRRAGVVRVRGISQLFHAAKGLAEGFRPRGSQLAIVCNGTGPGAMAADCADALGVPLARLTSDTVQALRGLLPHGWDGAMPIDLGGDATPERYLECIRALAQDAHVHATLVMLSPLAPAPAQQVARGIADIARGLPTTVCCCFMGGERVAEARRILDEAGIPVFRSPDTVIELFCDISRYFANQKLLLQVPGATRAGAPSSGARPRPLIEALVAERRSVLSAMESRALLAAWGVPVSPVLVAHDATEAMFAAERAGWPVCLRVEAPDLLPPADDTWTRQPLGSAEAVREAFGQLVQAARAARPDARVRGVAIEACAARPHARELMVGVLRDPTFGPVLVFGAGGRSGQIDRDRAVALPPLNAYLARDLIASAAVSRTLDAFGHLPAADRAALEAVLLAVSDMACELPWIRELRIDPLLLDEQGALAADVRMVIDPTINPGSDRYAHMAIHPYPGHLRRQWAMPDGSVVTVRPVRPEDAVLERAFIDALSPEARRMRFMGPAGEVPPSVVARMTQIDYDREMALLATLVDGGVERQVGSARYARLPDGQSVEFALAVADAWQRRGLGRRLMAAIIDCARVGGARAMVGDVYADNARMLGLMKALGFSVLPHPDEATLKRVVLALDEPAGQGAPAARA